MEIGSAYAVQVSLLQIPALVAYSAWLNQGVAGNISQKFRLLFPKLDTIAVILSIFLLGYIYTEGKSNYFKGSILVMTYLVWLAAFYFEPPQSSISGLLFFSTF